MKKSYRIYQVDSFTSNIFEGNPAGVVPDADGLSEIQMQKIARELNNSETAFIFSPEATDHEVRVRFFTPTVEVPSCGHATVAAHYIRALEKNLPTSTVLHKIGIGVLPVEIKNNNSDYEIYMIQGKPEFGAVLRDNEIDDLNNAFGIEVSQLRDEVPIQIVSTGHSKVMVALKSNDILQSLKPNAAALTKLSQKIRCNGYYVFSLDTNSEKPEARSRMFAPAIGIYEDPVNGNGSGPMAAYLVKYNLIKHNGRLFQTRANMGDAVKRPGIVKISVEIEDDEPVKVKIGGNAVIAFKTEIEI